MFSPRGLLVRAAILTLSYAIFHALGWREYASFLSGTVAGVSSSQIKMCLGALYVMLHFACVLVVPVLVLAAGLLFLGSRLWKTGG